MLVKPIKGENRTVEQISEHYEVEKELARRLRSANREERPHLYSSLYDEMYKRLPHHPQLTQKSHFESRALSVQMQMGFLRRFLSKSATYLELGPGDCSLSVEVAKYVREVYAVDVSSQITQGLIPPQHFHLILCNGLNIPLPPNSIDVAYSNQLMEHLHPEDAMEQLQGIHRVLAPGGIYVCVTPHRLSGPHDVSRYFDEIATGFHLKEYTIAELRDLFKKVGFSKFDVYAGGKGKYMSVPVEPVVLSEGLLSVIPRRITRAIVSNLPLRVLFGIRIVGRK